ncbi:MAG: hypothetical protein A49_24370 [Methyloceanibacter sp.]|nr:MAG: hypothetical protein A49_24370 [Methyloceanibacter sp.]
MWFPYSLPTSWKVDGDRQRANESQLDSGFREFLVAVQLGNPVSRDWSVELQLAETRTLLWEEESGERIELNLFPNEDGRLSEVVCKLSDVRLQAAVERSHAAVGTLLDFWSSDSGRGFSAAGLRVADLKHDARWRVMPHWPSALDLPIAIPEQLPQSFWPLARLYREGRTSSKDRYRFLCCYALIAKWSQAESPFDWRLRSSPDVSELAEASVSQEMMTLAGVTRFAPELEGVTTTELLASLAPWHEEALDFCMNGPSEGEDFDAIQRWAAIANLADISAHDVLRRTIAYWRRASHRVGPATSEHASGTEVAM